MERVVQLREHDYDQLSKYANLNEDKIKKLAEQYYQEKGVFRIDIKAELKEDYNSHINYIVHTFSTENGLYRQGKFNPIIPEKGRRKIERIMKDLAEEAFRCEFEDFAKARNFYYMMNNKFRFTKWICYTIAVSGWAVAAMLIIKTLLR